MDEADIDVSVAEGALTISGEKKLVREAKEKG
jgi:HSP20 family molecular chaperone IbpA